MREIACPGCGEVLGVPKDLEGGPIRCGVCDSVIETKDQRPAGRPTRDEPRDEPRERPRDDDPLERGRGRRGRDRSDDRDDDRPRRRPRNRDDDDYDRPKKKSGCGPWVWIIGIAGVLILGCCGGGGFLLYKASDPKWEAFTPPDSRWNAQFPGKPKVETKPIGAGLDTGVGTYYTSERLLGREAYLVGHGDLSPLEQRVGSNDAVMVGGLDGVLKSQLNAREISRRNLKMAGVDAKELTLDVTDPKAGSGRMVVRILVAENRIYTLIAVKMGQGAVNPEFTERFFDSFALTGKK